MPVETLQSENAKLAKRNEKTLRIDTYTVREIQNLFVELMGEIRDPYLNVLAYDESWDAGYEAEYLASMQKVKSVLTDLLMAEKSKHAK